MLDHKDFFDNFCNEDKLEKIIDIGFSQAENSNESSRGAAISVLNTLIQLFVERR
jgi:hypothetical protein